MFSSGGSHRNSEEFLKILEIQVGIAGLGDVILVQKRLEDVDKLKNIIDNLDSRLLKVFEKDVKRPLIEIICNFEQWLQSILFKVIICVQCLIKKGLVSSLEEIIIFYSRFFALIDADTNELKGTCLVSEDLKLKVLICVKNLLESLNVDIITSVLQLKHLHPMIGHSVHVLLSNSIDRYSSLALQSIVTLESVFNAFGKVPQVKVDKQIMDTGDIFASFFPGISIGLMKVITKDDKVPKTVLISCLNTFKSLLNITLSQPSAKASYFKENLVTKRSEQWLALSIEKLEIVLDKIVKVLVEHSHPIVRKNLVNFCYNVLNLMSKHKEIPLSKKLIKCIIILSVDEEQEVRIEAEKIIDIFFVSKDPSNSIRCHAIQDKFYQILTSSPRKFQCMTEDSKIVRVKLIAGYIKSLGLEGLQTFMLSESSRTRLFQCLIDLTTFKKKLIVAERLPVGIDSTNMEESQIPLNYTWKRSFKNFESEDVTKHLENCCQLLGKFVPSYALTDYLLNLLHDGPTTPSVLFIINNSMKGMLNSEALNEIVTYYVSRLEELTLKEDIDYRDSLILELLIEGLEIISRFYGPTRRNEILLLSLYPVLANTASEQAAISDAALICLKKFSINFAYKSIKELVEDNIDYLLNYINLKLKHYERDVKCCAVIKAILCFSDMNIFAYFDYTLNNILSKLDIFYATDCENLVNILYVVVCAIYSNCPKKQTPSIVVPSIEAQKSQAINSLKEFFESRKLCETLEDNQDEQTSETEFIEEDNVKDKNLPDHVKFVKKILERCCHLISNPKQEIKIKAMDIAIKGLQVLQSHEDELLPMAHQLWDPLLKRLHGSDLLILKKSFDCLNMMTICSGDFLRSRTVEYVMPKLCSFLRQQSMQSYGKTDSSPYKFTIEYKIQREVLNQIGSFCYHLKVCEKNLWSVIECLLPYISNQQPLSLQEAAKESITIISYVDTYSVHYYLKYYLPSRNERQSNYTENVKKILRAIW